MTSRILAAVAGVVSLVAAVVLVTDGGPSSVGSPDLAPSSVARPSRSPPPATPVVTSEPTGAVEATTTAADDPPTTTPPEPASPPTPEVQVGTRSGRIADLPTQTTPEPVRLRLPALDLDVRVEHVGVADDGQMEVPTDVDDAGWYRHGPAPGDPGNTVIAGHVDDREQGLGAFHRLVDLAVGDRVEVEAVDGTSTTWEVTGRELVDKSALETDDLFRRNGPAQLVLVTCGGEFDGTARSYRSNVVVVAQPS